MFSSRKPVTALAGGLAAIALGTIMSLPGGSAAYAGTLRASSSTNASTGSTTSTSVATKTANLATLQAKGEAAIDARTADITKQLAAVNASKNLTPAHKATLTTLLNTDQTDLTALRAKIAADTDRTTLVADVKSIVSDYRIYVLVDPKVHVTDAADAITSVSVKETAEVTTLQAAVAKLNAAGKDTSSISADLTTAQTQAQAAATAVAGQGDAILALQATDYPNNQGARDATRTAVKTGAADAKSSRASLKSAESAIKALKAS